MTAGLFQLFGPGNIVFFIETCFQLNEDRDLLPVFCRFGQRRNNGGIAAHAVQHLLDGQYPRIHGGILYKTYHRCKVHIRMMQENVFFPDAGKDIFIFRDIRHLCRNKRRPFICRKVIFPVEFHEESQIDRPGDGKRILIPYAEFFTQDLQKIGMHAFFCFQTDHLAPLSLFQLFPYFLKQISCFFFIDAQLGIPHDPVRMSTDNVISGKQSGQIAFDHFIDQDQGMLFAAFPRNLHVSRQNGRYLYSRKEKLFMVFLILAADQSTDIQSLVPDQRKRPG